MTTGTERISVALLEAPAVKQALWTELLRSVAVPYAAECGIHVDPASIQFSADCSRIEPVPGYEPPADTVEPVAPVAPASVDRALAAAALYRQQRAAKAAAKRSINNRKPIAPDDKPVPIGKLARRYGYKTSTLRDYAREGRFSSAQNQKHQHIVVGERSFLDWHSGEEATKAALDLSAAGKPLTREQDHLVEAHYAKRKVANAVTQV